MRNQLKKGQKLDHRMVVKSENYFEKRSEVMSIIYELKALVELPRIEVKIGDAKEISGLGHIGKANYIVIEGRLSGLELFHVVLHELVHTAFKYKGHNENCKLMSAQYNSNKLASREELIEIFLTYAK